jgi:hypothetical protein
VARLPGQDCVVDERQRIRAARIFGQRRVIEIQATRLRIDHDIFQKGPEALCRRIDLRLRFCRQLDHFRVAAAFKVEDASIAPSMLIVADQAAQRIARQCGLAGP